MAPLLIEELKILILQKVGIRVISPSDCATIALEISRSLKKNISETTIKRLFGFAARNHQFSKFTVNTLIEYVDGEKVNEIVHHLPAEADEDWDFLVNRSRMITEQTIQQIEQGCSMPYEFTIERKFAVHDFDYFYNSNYSFTAFVAQPGYGKSIMMSHLIKKRFLKPEAKYQNDVVLFLPASRIFNVERDVNHLEDELKKLLGISSPQSLISYFDDWHLKNGAKLNIFLDICFDHQHVKWKQKIFDSIIQLLCDIEDSDSVKIVLNMRSYIWRRFFETIRHSYYLKSKWYTGSYYRLKHQANIPVFTDTEIDQWLTKIDAPLDLAKTAEMKSHFKHPFHLEYYFQLKDEFVETTYRSNIIFYEITLRYLNHKIYQSKYAAEKLVICKQLILFSIENQESNKVSKNLLINELRLFRDAYMELLKDGVLIEEQQNDDFFLTEWIHFVQPHIFDYFLFKEVIESKEEQLGKCFWAFIYHEYQDHKQYRSMIHWSILHYVKKNEFDLIQGILSIPLSYDEQNELLLFFVENIHYQINTDPEAKHIFSQSNLHQEFVSRLTDLDFLSPIFQQIFNTLLLLEPDSETLTIYQSILCLQDALTFNKEQLSSRLAHLKRIDYGDKWEITPTSFAEFILMNFDGEPLQIHRPIQIPEVVLKNNTETTIFFISRLYAILESWFNEDPIESAKIIQEVYQLLPQSYRSNSFSVYVLHILALATVKLGPSKKGDQIYRMLDHLHHFPLSKKQSEWTKGLYQLFLAHVNYNEGAYTSALSKADASISYFKRHQNFALELLATHFIINMHLNLNDVDQVNENRCIILNELENRGIHTRLFDITRQQLIKNFSF